MAPRNRAFFIERTAFVLRIARVVHGVDLSLVEDVAEANPGSVEEARGFIQDFTKEKTGNLVRAYCAVYPPGRRLHKFEFKDGPQNLERSEMLSQAAERCERSEERRGGRGRRAGGV